MTDGIKLELTRGCKVLSEHLPRKVSDIESIMSGDYRLSDNRLMETHEYEKLIS